MKNNRALLLSIAAVFFFLRSFAQTVAELSTLKAPVAPITVDADLKEWGDSLKYYSEDTGERFAFTNDKDNIYFAIKLEDLAQAMRVLKSGLTLGIDPKGKKNPAYKITFPVNNQVGAISKPLQSNSLNGVTQADRDELHRELITNLRGIKVEGFKDIEGDMITTSNTYGIKTAIDYDAKGNLICEAAIPLKFFNADIKSKSEWSFDIKMNAVTNAPPKTDGSSPTSSGFNARGSGNGGGMGGGRGGRGGAGRTGQGYTPLKPGEDETHGGLNKAVEFAGKFALAPVQ